MKKKLLLLCLCCLILLTGCGKSKVAKETETLINSIGEVNLSSEENIIKAEEYYDTLTDNQKDEVENYKILVDARKKLDSLKLVDSFQTKANELVEEKVKKQSDIDELTKIYDSLSPEQLDSLEDKDIYEKAISLTDHEKAAISATQQLKKSLKNEDSLKLQSVNVVDGNSSTPSAYYVKLDYSASNSFGGTLDDTSYIDVSKNFGSSLWELGRGLGMLTGTENTLTELDINLTYSKRSNAAVSVDCDRIMANIDTNVKENK